MHLLRTIYTGPAFAGAFVLASVETAGLAFEFWAVDGAAYVYTVVCTFMLCCTHLAAYFSGELRQTNSDVHELAASVTTSLAELRDPPPSGNPRIYRVQ
jgi:hypothetical protein